MQFLLQPFDLFVLAIHLLFKSLNGGECHAIGVDGGDAAFTCQMSTKSCLWICE